MINNKKIRVLWIIHDSLLLIGQKKSGFWIDSLLNLLAKIPYLEIFIAFPGDTCGRVNDHFFTFQFPVKNVYNDIPDISKENIIYLISQIKPNLIHIHGTEKPFLLIKKHTNIPIVISLQGFISECNGAVLGNIPIRVWKKYKTAKEYVLDTGFMRLQRNWRQNSKYEIDGIKINKYFIGRTEFDRQVVKKYNSDAVYFTGHEVLRDDFYKTSWDINNIDRYSIFTSSFANPLKGFHILLDAINILITQFPQIKVFVPGIIHKSQTNTFWGNSYYRFIWEKITEYKLNGSIIFLGFLESEKIAHILTKSHVFVLPSLIENSSNSLGEAMLIGTPSIVASNSGGTDYIIKDKFSGMYFLNSDYIDLANKISKLFNDDELSVYLSNNSKEFGKIFHNKNKIVEEYVYIYNHILN